MALAAACYAAGEPLYRVAETKSEVPGRRLSRVYEFTDAWPDNWPDNRYRIENQDRIRELTRAGALIAAEIDRRLRAGEG